VQRDTAEASAALSAMVKGLRAKLDTKYRAIQELNAKYEKVRPFALPAGGWLISGYELVGSRGRAPVH